MAIVGTFYASDVYDAPSYSVTSVDDFVRIRADWSSQEESWYEHTDGSSKAPVISWKVQLATAGGGSLLDHEIELDPGVTEYVFKASEIPLTSGTEYTAVVKAVSEVGDSAADATQGDVAASHLCWCCGTIAERDFCCVDECPDS